MNWDGLKTEQIYKIEIVWEGPFTIEEAINKMDNKTEYGLYQIYGTHSVYGGDSLLYIGKSDGNVFKHRMKSHYADWIQKEPSKVSVYLGYFVGENEAPPSDEIWSRYIDYAEKLLIYCCQPSYNVREKYWKPMFEKEFVVLNFKRRHQLPAVFSSLILHDEKNRLKKWSWLQKPLQRTTDESM